MNTQTFFRAFDKKPPKASSFRAFLQEFAKVYLLFPFITFYYSTGFPPSRLIYVTVFLNAIGMSSNDHSHFDPLPPPILSRSPFCHNYLSIHHHISAPRRSHRTSARSYYPRSHHTSAQPHSTTTLSYYAPPHRITTRFGDHVTPGRSTEKHSLTRSNHKQFNQSTSTFYTPLKPFCLCNDLFLFQLFVVFNPQISQKNIPIMHFRIMGITLLSLIKIYRYLPLRT